jgi:hypothetical protein
MSRRKSQHQLDNYTEVFQEKTDDDHAMWYITITRHLPSKQRTYFKLWFKNPREPEKRDKREPDEYVWYYRINWKQDRLENHTGIKEGKDTFNSGYWRTVLDSESPFNWTKDEVMPKIQSILMDYEMGLHT